MNRIPKAQCLILCEKMKHCDNRNMGHGSVMSETISDRMMKSDLFCSAD